MYGNSNLSDSSSITIYNDETLQDPQWTFNSSTDQPHVDIYMQSYIFTGSETSWLLFEGYNYTGNSTCLGPSEFVQRNRFGITYSWRESLGIKSIKPMSSCPTEDPDPELTTEPNSSGVFNFSNTWKNGSFGMVIAFLLCFYR